MTCWPFKDPENTAVFTMRQIIQEGAPILRVSHDRDGAWQFLGTSVSNTDDAALIGLGEAYKLDPSIGELADLPCEWHATRETPQASWVRVPPKPKQGLKWWTWAAILAFLACWLVVNARFTVLWDRPWLILVAPLGIVGILVFFRLRRTALSLGLLSLGILGVVYAQTLPIYSQDWNACDRLEISYWDKDTDQERTVAVTDPKELAAFKDYGKRGHYGRMLKCGSSRELSLWQGNARTRCFAHGNSIGPRGGGNSQTVFRPAKPGFKEFLDSLIQKYGAQGATPSLPTVSP